MESKYIPTYTRDMPRVQSPAYRGQEYDNGAM